jgi:hypothetical protein
VKTEHLFKDAWNGPKTKGALQRLAAMKNKKNIQKSYLKDSEGVRCPQVPLSFGAGRAMT